MCAFSQIVTCLSVVFVYSVKAGIEMSLTAVSSFSFLPRDAVKCMHWHRTWSVRLSLSVCPSVCNVDLSWLYKRTLGYLGK